MDYYIIQDNETKGPYTIGQMRSMWNSGVLNLETKFCQEGDSEWTGISVLLPLLEPAPTVSPASPATQPSVQDSEPAQRVQTIEATSKNWKMKQAIAALLMFGGFPIMLFSFGAGLIAVIIGLILYAYATSPPVMPTISNHTPVIVRETPVGFLGKRGTIFGTMNLGCAGIVIILITILAISLSGC